jgi:Kef-type K+ transport system membrane component KefB
MPNLPQEAVLLMLIVGLLVLPRMLQRYRIPAPLASFGLGMIAAVFLSEHATDPTLSLFATLGISSLFLFAGLEVELSDFRRGQWPLVRHVILRAATLATVAYGLVVWLDFQWPVAVLLGLAVLTPSAGFILDTLSALELDEDERYWIRMKAIAGELFALVVLFVVLQSSSVATLALSTVALSAMIVGLPLLLIGLGRYVVPYARGSEFSLLVMVGIVAAYLTYKLGVYYLVGAFLAGFIARLLHQRMPALASDQNLHAVRMFASFFVPFYFFHKGMGVPHGALSWQALGLGVGIALAVLPLRIGVLWVQRRLIAGESAKASLKVAAALTPTLIFTLVIATILRERYAIPEYLYGALLVYAALATVLPSLVMTRPIGGDLLLDEPPVASTPASSEVRTVRS